MLEALLVSSLEKVGLGQDPVPLGEENLNVFLGENMSFQIAYRDVNAGKGAGIKVDKRVQRVSDGIRQEAQSEDAPMVRIRQVLPVMCRRSCNPEAVDENYLFLDARMAPDLLRDVEGEVSLTDQWQSLWVDICPEEKQEPGRYRVSILLWDNEKRLTERVVEVCVIGRTLPPLPILHTEWFHCDGIVDYYGVEAFSEEFWRIFRNFVNVYVKRGGNMIYVPVLTPPLDTGVGLERTTVQLVRVELAAGKYDFDFSNLDRFLEICLSEGIRQFEICHLFSQWGAAAAPKVVAWEDGTCRKIFGWDTPSDSPEYLGFLEEMIPALKEFLAGKGLMDRTYFHISDEPNLTSVQYQTAQGAVRPLLEGCTIIEAVSEYEYFEKGLVDIPVCATNHIEPFLEKRPPVLWSYYCCAQEVEVPNRFISMPSWRNRIYGILLYWLKIDGFLHWGFNFYNSILSRKQINPYESVDADGGFPAGDPFLVYPGEGGIPEESIRIMVQDEGINDYRALYALESQLGREKVMELIRQEAGMDLSFRHYPGNEAFILGLRRKVDQLLAEAL